MAEQSEQCERSQTVRPVGADYEGCVRSEDSCLQLCDIAVDNEDDDSVTNNATEEREESGDSESRVKLRHSQAEHDVGWSWVVALASHMICAMVGGLVYTGGVLLDDFQAEFGETRSTVAVGAACMNAFYQFCGPLASILTNRFGSRAVIVIGTLTASSALMIASWSPNSTVLILTYGVLCGLGLGMMYLAGIVAVSTYFQEKRTVATGLATCGSGVGMIVFAPLTNFLLHEYGLSWTLMVLGSVVLHGLVAAALVRPQILAIVTSPSSSSWLPAEKKEGTQEEKHGQWQLLRKAFNFSVLKRTDYWLVLLGNFLASLGMIVPLLYIAERAKQVGVGEARAVTLLSIIGIANTVSRFISALVVQLFRLNSVLVTALALLLCGLVAILFPQSESYSPLAAMSAFYGMGMAAFITLSSVMLCDILGPDNLASAFGLVTMVRGVATMVGPPLAGAIIDSTGVFAPAFYLGGGMIVLGGLSLLLLYLLYFTTCRKHIETLVEDICALSDD